MFVHASALGRMRLQQKKYTEAEPLFREVLSIWKQDMPNDWSRFHSESLLGREPAGPE